jgi:hypothetical protein
VKKFVPAVAVAAMMATFPAYAQGGGSVADQKYCAALSDLYQRYVGNPETEPRNVRRNDIDADSAISQCRHGNTAAAIPVLERKLSDNKITLPQRQ